MFRKQNDAPTANSFQIQASPEKRPAAPPKAVSVLGPTLSIKGGELSFDEDLIIEGTVEGKIAHQGHHLTIGKSGRVKANIRARLITVYGTVEGDLHGDEGVEISASARVTGNVVGPRVTLEGGATFSHTFDEAGTYPYTCLIHPEMRGTVTVAGAADAVAPSVVPAASPSAPSSAWRC